MEFRSSYREFVSRDDASLHGTWGASASELKAKFGKEPGTPGALWASNPRSRPVSAIGAFQQITSPNGSTDAIISVAMGYRPGIFGPLDDRATVLGGVAALAAAGVEGYTEPRGLSVTFGKTTKSDPGILKAAGMSSLSMSAAATKMRKLVKEQGLGKIAWGYRATYLLKALPTLQTVQGIGTAALSFIPIVGLIISGIESTHMGISAAAAKSYSTKAQTYIEEGLSEYKEAQAKKLASNASLRATMPVSMNIPTTVSPATSSLPPWVAWAVGGLLLAGAGIAMVRSRRGGS